MVAVVLALSMSSPSHALDRGDFGAFMRSLNKKSYGYTVVNDPTGRAPASKVERFEVRPGDCSRNRGWDDCKKDRERSELSERRKSTGHGQEKWYGWSIYVPKDWTNVWPTKVALGQFHQAKSHPIWMFQNSNGGLFLDQQISGRSDRYYALLSAAQLRGNWNRIEVHAKWSRNENGFFRVYVNGTKKVDYSGRTMTASAVYFKYGVYRSYMSRYKNQTGSSTVPGQIAYYANVKRARNRNGL